MTFAEFLAAKEANRKGFAEAHPSVIQAFEVSVANFAVLGEQLRVGRDRTNHTHISLAPFYFILQRSAFAAYDAVSSNQAYQAWVALRPGVESALIMGKWVDHPKNADIWERRFKDVSAYRKVYQGKGLESASLPGSAAIRSALTHINDLFLHPNPRYYYRHLSVEKLPDGNTSMELNFFDKTNDVYVGTLGILHLVVTVQHQIAQMFGALFANVSQLDVGLADFEAKAGGWRASLGAENEKFEWELVNLGLWPPAT